jgi:hypothetical protein
MLAALPSLLLTMPSCFADTKTHCTSEETVVFSCPVSKQKVASICKSKELSETTGYLQYRFGKLGKPEIMFPPQTERPGKYVKYKRVIYSGGGGSYFRFNNPPYTYAVHVLFGRGWGEKYGVAVLRNDKTIARHKCTRAPTGEPSNDYLLDKGIPEDPDELTF